MSGNGNITAAEKAAHVPNKKYQFGNVTENVEPEHYDAATLAVASNSYVEFDQL